MQVALGYIIASVLSAGFAWLGRWVSRNGERVANAWKRNLPIGEAGEKFIKGCCKIVGSIAMVVFAVGIPFYLVLAVLALFGTHI